MSRAAFQLPSGRHGLSREAVVTSQRTRMRRAMIDAVAAKGYAKVTVADVLRGAGVSRETFYEHFESGREQCFLEALEAADRHLAAELSDAFGAGREPVRSVGAVLGAYLDALAADPAAARVFLIDVYAAGEAAIARRVAVNARFVDLVARFAGTGGVQQRLRCEAFVGALSSMVTMRVARGETASLPELQEPMTALACELLF